MSEKGFDSWTDPKYNKIAREDVKPKANHVRRGKKNARKKGKKARRDIIIEAVRKVKENKDYLDRNKGKKTFMVEWHRDAYNRYRAELQKLIKETKDIEIDPEWRKL